MIEALKASVKEYSKQQSNPILKKQFSAPQEKSQQEMTQDQLADIYFSNGQKNKKSEYPMVIKVVEKPHVGSVLPWIMATLAFLMAAFSLFSSKRIFVDIRVIDDKFMQSSAANTKDEDVEPAEPADASNELTAGDGLYGDSLMFRRFEFEGAGRLKSSKDPVMLTMTNSSVAPFARAVLRFKKPVNLAGTKIVFYAKGQKGGENLAFALKDRDNVLAFDRGKIFPFNKSLTTDWQKTEIKLTETAAGFDENFVQSMRFEFGTKDTQNKANDTVYIKDLKILPL